MRYKINWYNPNVEVSEHRIYRSEATIDPNNLPAPIATLSGTLTEFFDDTVQNLTTYHYRIGALVNGVEYVSDENVVFVDSGDIYEREFVEIVMVVASTSHSTANNTRAALVAAGFLDENITTVLEGSSIPVCDIILIVRGINSAAHHNLIDAAWKNGTPVIFGSSNAVGAGDTNGLLPSTRADLTGLGTATSGSNTSSGINSEFITAANHYITQGLTLGQETQIYTSHTFGFCVTSGEPWVGTLLATGQENRSALVNNPTLLALPSGVPDLNGNPIPVRTVVWTNLYGASAYNANGQELLGRCIDWCLGNGAD